MTREEKVLLNTDPSIRGKLERPVQKEKKVCIKDSYMERQNGRVGIGNLNINEEQ